jgi:hypothetical protein
MAVQNCVTAPGKEKPGGMMPMTVKGSSSRRMVRPMTDGSAANRFLQRASERTTVPAAPPRSSSAEKMRPSAGRAPRRGVEGQTLPVEPAWPIAADEVGREAHRRSHRLEGPAPALPVAEVGRRELQLPGPPEGLVLPEANETIGLGKGKGPDQGAVEDRISRRSRADSEGRDENDRDRETG